MIAFGGSDDVHASARAHAARGEWGVVRSLLAGDAAAAREPELLLLAAEAAMRVGLPREASERLRDGWAGLEGAADGAALRRACNLLGAAAFELGDLIESHRAFARALDLAGADGDHLLVARATNNLGAIANLRGDRERALVHFQLAIPAYQQLGHTRGLAESCHNLAIAYRDARRLEDAEDYERRAMEYAQESGSARVAAMARAGRAELSLLRGDPRLAEREATIAAEAHRRLEDPIGEADALRLVGEARLALGTIDAAMRAIDAAVNLATAHGAALVQAEALRTRADAHRVRGEVHAARDDARAALDLFEQLGAVEERNRTAELLGSLGV